MAKIELETHECEWRVIASEQEKKIASLEAQLSELKRHVYGKRSEKMPSVKNELRKAGTIEHDPDNEQKNRRERRAQRASLPRVIKVHKVASDLRHCPSCDNAELKPIGDGKKTYTVEYFPARFECHEHFQETLTCASCDHIVTANGPVRPTENGKYGAGFIAHVVTAKCCDSIPLYRMEKQFKRIGYPMSRSSLCDVFHQAANATQPIWKRMIELVPQEPLVLADETEIPVMAKKKTKKGYIWAFVLPAFIVYFFSISRGRITPNQILGSSEGVLVTDGYAGYNEVCKNGRQRAVCWAHVRRKFFDATKYAPKESQYALDTILDLYKIEYEAARRNKLGEKEHHLLRQERAPPILKRFSSWLEDQKEKHLPKGPMGKAIAYALNNWVALNTFVDNAAVPLDNNSSERALRIIALGRKNYLFVQNEDAGTNLAGLYSLIATCEMHGINPEKYLADVMIRVQTHPAKDIDELLPQRWAENFAEE